MVSYFKQTEYKSTTMGISCCLDYSIHNDGCLLVYISQGYLLLIYCWITNILYSNAFEYHMDSYFLLEKNDNFGTGGYYCTLVYNFSNNSSFCFKFSTCRIFVDSLYFMGYFSNIP